MQEQLRARTLQRRQAQGLGPGTEAGVTGAMTWGEVDQAGMLWSHFTGGFGAENASGVALMCSLWLSSGDQKQGTRLPANGFLEGHEKSSQVQIIFKEEPMGFSDGFDVCCE